MASQDICQSDTENPAGTDAKTEDPRRPQTVETHRSSDRYQRQSDHAQDRLAHFALGKGANHKTYRGYQDNEHAGADVVEQLVRRKSPDRAAPVGRWIVGRRLILAGPITNVETQTTAQQEQAQTDPETPQRRGDERTLRLAFGTSLV